MLLLGCTERRVAPWKDPQSPPSGSPGQVAPCSVTMPLSLCLSVSCAPGLCFPGDSVLSKLKAPKSTEANALMNQSCCPEFGGGGGGASWKVEFVKNQVSLGWWLDFFPGADGHP